MKNRCNNIFLSILIVYNNNIIIEDDKKINLTENCFDEENIKIK